MSGRNLRDGFGGGKKENKVIRIKETAVKYVNVIISVDDVRNDLRP